MARARDVWDCEPVRDPPPTGTMPGCSILPVLEASGPEASPSTPGGGHDPPRRDPFGWILTPPAPGPVPAGSTALPAGSSLPGLVPQGGESESGVSPTPDGHERGSHHAPAPAVPDSRHRAPDGRSSGDSLDFRRIRGRTRLKDGDVVRCGSFLLTFRSGDAWRLDDAADRRIEGSSWGRDREGVVRAVPPRVEVRRGDDERALSIAITQPSLTVGRATRLNDLALPDKRISRLHMRIFCKDGCRYYAEDLDSKHGTYLARRAGGGRADRAGR